MLRSYLEGCVHRAWGCVRYAAVAVALSMLTSCACSSDENAAQGANGGGAGSSGAAGTQGGAGLSAAGGAGVGASAGRGAGGGAAGTPAGGAAGAVTSGASVLQHHKNATRDGVYVDAAFTKAAAAALHRDSTFTATLSGPTYAQPLYLENGSGGKDIVILATERNEVVAFDAANGTVVWQKTLATPVPRSNLPCGNIDPMGITGTPAIDAASRTLLVNAMTLDAGVVKHKVFALATEDGSTKSGWPVDVGATATANGLTFESPVHGERGALLVMNGNVYVPYGGHFGDCGNYHGWVVGISIANPAAAPTAWATRGRAGGIWASGGIASDGQSLYVATGNTLPATTWMDGEAIIRLGPNLAASQNTVDYFAPSDWAALDARDVDLGGSGPIIFDVPGATPSELVMGLGKDGKAYLLDRKNLGGIGGALAITQVSSDRIIQAAAAYRTAQGSYVVFKGHGTGCPNGSSGQLTALKISPASPPTVSVAWCAGPAGAGSPMVTTTNGTADPVVWWVAAEGDGRLRGFDGDTGAVINDGANALVSNVRRFQTPIAAKGRIFSASDQGVIAFTPN